MTWINRDDGIHSVTSRDGVFGSPGLLQYQIYKYQFNDVGRFPYHCNYGNMNGTVVVHALPTSGLIS